MIEFNAENFQIKRFTEITKKIIKKVKRLAKRTKFGREKIWEIAGLRDTTKNDITLKLLNIKYK